MPKSKVRDKVRKQKKVIQEVEQFAAEDEKLESPSWLAPVMVANFIFGLIWIVIFYISGTAYPIPGIYVGWFWLCWYWFLTSHPLVLITSL